MIILGGLLLSLGLTVGSYFWFPFFSYSYWFLLLLPVFFLFYMFMFINFFWLSIMIGTRKYKGQAYNPKVSRFYLYCVHNCAIALLFLKRIRIKKMNLHKIPKQPALILFNHISDFDCWALYKVLKGKYTFVGKLALLKVPVIGALSSAIGTLYCENGETELNRAMVDHAVEHINTDTSVCIAPEGTRDFTGKILPFKHGGFNIALRCKCPIICIGITNMEKVLQKKRGLFTTVGIDAFKIISPNEYEGMTAGQLAEYSEGIYLDYLKQR